MIHNIEAIYDHGVFRPVEPLPLPDGLRVHLRIEEENGRPAESSEERADYATWLDGLVGRWQGEFVPDSEGDRHVALLSALDLARKPEPIGSMRREELYDRDNLR